ncbi:MAG: NAD(P)H-dependent oxidoreductase subunit E [Firmicutes bacterium]|nr:NAD(P)H-dependent oxidoreductase subunit E [Bacillota bacterium]MDD4693095.1 NAD(P)H-dependent oxidoreductase subunit E [Bacillota bacterium]
MEDLVQFPRPLAAKEKKQQVLEIFERYKKDPHYLLPLLNDIQQNIGYISTEVLHLASDHFGIPLGRVYSVATFSKQFKFSPPGKYVIEVCSGAGCKVKDGTDILAVLEAELGIKAGQTTQNGLFTLFQRSCIDACALAPAIRVNGHLYGKLEPKDVLKIIKEYEIML